MKRVYEQISIGPGCRALNPDVFKPSPAVPPAPVTVGKRVRQDTKPLLNKLESSWLAHLQALHPSVKFHGQGKRYRIAAGAWYKPDVTALLNGVEFAWECKGPKQMKNVARGILALKATAALWPEVTFLLVWRDAGRWMTQKILP